MSQYFAGRVGVSNVDVKEEAGAEPARNVVHLDEPGVAPGRKISKCKHWAEHIAKI